MDDVDTGCYYSQLLNVFVFSKKIKHINFKRFNSSNCFHASKYAMNNLLILVVILFVSVFLQSRTAKCPANQFGENISKRKKVQKLYTILEVEILVNCEKYNNHKCLTTACLTDWYAVTVLKPQSPKDHVFQVPIFFLRFIPIIWSSPAHTMIRGRLLWSENDEERQLWFFVVASL